MRRAPPAPDTPHTDTDARAWPDAHADPRAHAAALNTSAHAHAAHADADVRAAALAIVALSRPCTDTSHSCFVVPPPPPPVSVLEPVPQLKPEPDSATALAAAVSPAPDDYAATRAAPRVVACDACRRSRKKCVFPTRRSPAPGDDGDSHISGGCLACVRRGVLCSAVAARRKSRSCKSAVPPAQSAQPPVKPPQSPSTAVAATDDTAQPMSAHPHRIPVSCKLCYSKKMRCDRGRPGCSACTKRGVECSYWSQQQLLPSPSPPPSSPVASHGVSDSPTSSIFSVKVAPSITAAFGSQAVIPSASISSDGTKVSLMNANEPFMGQTLDAIAKGFWP
ncbi:hypothetical protein HDU82_003871 [Entophlyctis luteolus]|nr:hypothetical protein HDU82_003871 [Entophlyctis luteolus]